MSRLFGRLALGLFGAFALAGTASAQQAAYADSRGYGYAETYASGSRETQVHTEDRYGARSERSGSSYEYGSRDGYERVRHESGPRPCDWTRDPRDPGGCPPGYGLVTLPGSFFQSSGSVGPEIIYYGGGGGGYGYGYAYAGAAAGAYAFASASASARISYGGGRGGHRLGKRGGHCGCR